MDADALKTLSRLITTERVSSLGTVHEGAPFVSMALYVASNDFNSFFLHLSRLAVHTKDILADPRISLMIAEADRGESDPQTLGRLTLLGEAREIDKSTTEYSNARALYLQRFPDSAMTFGLGDFALFAVRPRSGRLVAGFARTFNITGEDLRRASAA